MPRPSQSAKDQQTPAEAVGYIAGFFVSLARVILPLRIWIILIASIALIVFAFRSESALHITRALCIYATLISLLLGLTICRKQP